MLKLASTEPAWLEILPGVRVKFAPVGISAIRAARRAARDALQAAPDDIESAGDALSREMLRRGIMDWEGVGTADGEVLPFSEQLVEAFLLDPAAYEAADRAYVAPWARADTERNAEKNVSSPSPSGTGAGETPAKGTARSAARPRMKAAAKSAPTASKSRKPTKA